MKNTRFGACFVLLLLAALCIVYFVVIKNNGVGSARNGAGQTDGTQRSVEVTRYPHCPPVNREKPLTKEQAEKLYGTGYGGTRPNSSAENTEVARTMMKCRNCGYHTDNGLNSYCDYCEWMLRYGGGLPTQPTEAPPETTSRRAAKTEETDPYGAAEYYDPDDFYFDYYDDFWDYEDAEEYWEAHQDRKDGGDSYGWDGGWDDWDDWDDDWDDWDDYDW